MTCPGFGIDFVSSSLSIVLIGVSLALAVSALFASCDGAALGAEPCADVSGVGGEELADEESEDEGTAGGVDGSEDDAGADGEVGACAAMRSFATSSDRLHAPRAKLRAISDTSAAWIPAFI